MVPRGPSLARPTPLHEPSYRQNRRAATRTVKTGKTTPASRFHQKVPKLHLEATKPTQMKVFGNGFEQLSFCSLVVFVATVKTDLE